MPLEVEVSVTEMGTMGAEAVTVTDEAPDKLVAEEEELAEVAPPLGGGGVAEDGSTSAPVPHGTGVPSG